MPFSNYDYEKDQVWSILTNTQPKIQAMYYGERVTYSLTNAAYQEVERLVQIRLDKAREAREKNGYR